MSTILFIFSFYNHDHTNLWIILSINTQFTRITGLSCRRVILAERYNWAATRGVNEVMLLESLPEDLQRDIRRHLFKFVKKVST